MRYILFFIANIIIWSPVVIFAQELRYQSIVSIPGFNETQDFNQFINTLYALSIGLAALLAVIKIIIGGMKWMLSDVVTTKSDAKKDIQGALFGLIIVIAAVLIITVINPTIINTGGN